MKTQLLLVAHGSRNPRWQQTLGSLEAQLQAATGEDGARMCFLELHGPSLEEAVESALAMGIERFRLLPLFLAGGHHVERDIPSRLAALERAHPGLDVDVLPPLGEYDAFVDWLRQLATELVR